MPKLEQQPDKLWSVVDDSGRAITSGLSNAQAWRKLDKITSEPVSASEVERQMKEPAPRTSADQMQEFFSGLLHIEAQRRYKSGWAWHKFCEKFGHQPEGLRREPCKPSKQIWGWVNRKAIGASRK
jgi:hypothetical protein